MDRRRSDEKRVRHCLPASNCTRQTAFEKRQRNMLQTRLITATVLLVLVTSQAIADEPAVDNDYVAPPPSYDGSSPLNQASALEIALANNQGLAALSAGADAMGAIPRQAGALPDPKFGVNALNLPTDTFDFDQEPMTQLQFSLSQSFPFPGKRGLKREAAEYEATAANMRFADQRFQVAANVRSAWWQLVYLDKAIEIVEQNQGLMRDFVEIAQTKYRVGKGLQQDVLLAQLELSRLLDRLFPLRGLRSAAQADLNALLNLPADQPVVLPAAPANLSLSGLPPEAELLQSALQSRPLLDVARELAEASRSRMDLAKKNYYPDFEIGAGYGFRDGEDPVRGERPDLASFMLRVNIPLYFKSKQSKALDQRSSEYFQSKHMLNDTLRSIQAAIARNYAQYHASRNQVSLFGTAIIPQARQTVSAMLSGYQVNEVDFLNVLNAQITLYNAQISYWEAMSNAKRALANLAASVGSDNIYE
jgi:cobalt-zinc-cadmium efflux system outer membrane protein